MKKKIIIIISIIVVLAAIVTTTFIITNKNKSNNKNDITEKKEKTEKENEEKPEEQPESKTKVENPPIEEKKYDYKKKTLKKKKDSDILLTFDSNGGKEVDDILIEDPKEEADKHIIKLPTPEREGYFFYGWEIADYGDSSLYKGVYRPYYDTNFKAVWLTLNQKDRTMTVSFDNNNLFETAPITILCNKPITFLPEYYVNGYNYTGWTTEEGTIVNESSILECKDTTLHLKYKKMIEYECPDGFDLSVNICYKNAEPKTICNEDEILLESVCLDPTDVKIPEKKCSKQYVPVGPNHEYQAVEGTYLGNDICGYLELPFTNQKDCKNNDGIGENEVFEGKWQNGKCYTSISDFADFKCPEGYKKIMNEYSLPGLKKEYKEDYCIKINMNATKCPEGYNLDVRQNARCYISQKAQIKK